MADTISMGIDVKDFLPVYSNVNNTEYPVLNPYSNFYDSIYHKKEFYENRLSQVESFPKERGMLTKHQKTIARYFSSHTPYDRLLLVHEMGSGKTCSAIGAIEQCIAEGSKFRSALILANGKPLLGNFIDELVMKCTSGQYIPDNYSKLTSMEKIRRIQKKTEFYQFETFRRFASTLEKSSDETIKREYSNIIVVIDEVHNLRIQDNDKESTVKVYNQYHRFLHLIENAKVMCLSGTPMKDNIQEIASVCNLLLPLNNQFPIEKAFLDEYMKLKDGIYTIRESKTMEFRNKIKGVISFLREAKSTVTKEFIGEKKVGGLKHFVVQPCEMSDFQHAAYKESIITSTDVYLNSREASLFVFPDGSIGNKGFKTYIIKERRTLFAEGKKSRVIYSYHMKPELRSVLKGKDDKETLLNMQKYSTSYAAVISQILETKGNCFVYSSLVTGSGAILFALLLELFGFSSSSGIESHQRLRYAILTNETTDSRKLKSIASAFNNKNNAQGEYIKVIIGSKTVSEGFSFRNVVFEAILTPHWNYSETAQAIARGIRLGSHRDLIAMGIVPVVKIIQPVAISTRYQLPLDDYIDMKMYKLSEQKDISIRGILHLLMESSFDCALNYMRNRVTNEKDYSRECDYTICNYECTDMNMEIVEKGLKDEELDYSTYNIYYANPKLPILKRKIEQLVKENTTIDINSIVMNLSKEFTEDEIKNALYSINEQAETDEFDYRQFLEIYSQSAVKQIMNRIELLFRGHFSLDLHVIREQINDAQYSAFEIITALRVMINSNYVIINKYGLYSYLREENNVYFLVNNMTTESDYYSKYYTEYPHLSVIYDTDNAKAYIRSSLPKIISKICNSKNKEEFSLLIKSVPLQIREYFLEAAISAKEQNIHKDLIEYVLSYFEPYIKKYKSTWISTLLKEEKSENVEKIWKCLDKGVWSECDDMIETFILKNEKETKEEKKKDNPYGLIGKYNPANDSFCIIDYNKEVKKRVDGGVDRRLLYSGKVCGSGGWKLSELLMIVLKRLSIPMPETAKFRENYDKDALLRLVDSSIREVYSREEMQSMNDAEIRRVLYWGLPPSDGGQKRIATLCTAIKEWLDKKGLLEIDHQCGVQGKKKATEGVSGVKKQPIRIEVYKMTGQKEDRFKEYLKDMTKIYKEFYKVDKVSFLADDTTWILMFSRKKLVGMVNVDNEKIKYFCVATNYMKRTELISDGINLAIDYIGSKLSIDPVLQLPSHIKGYEKILGLYKTYGLKILRVDGKITYLSNK